MIRRWWCLLTVAFPFTPLCVCNSVRAACMCDCVCVCVCNLDKIEYVAMTCGFLEAHADEVFCCCFLFFFLFCMLFMGENWDVSGHSHWKEFWGEWSQNPW